MRRALPLTIALAGLVRCGSPAPDSSLTLPPELPEDPQFPELVLSESAVDFGAVLVGRDLSVVVEIQNLGSVPADVSLAFDGGRRSDAPDAGEAFTVGLVDRTFDEQGRLALAAGELVRLSIRYAPDREGTEAGRLGLTACDGAPGCAVELALSGRGVNEAIECGPASLDFAATGQGSCRSLTAECTNVTSEGARIDSIALTPGSSPSFAFESRPAQTIAAGATVVLDVEYCPRGFREDRGAVVFAHAATDSPTTLPLIGRGAFPYLEAVPSRIDFGLVSVGVPIRRGLILSNRGMNAVAINQIVVDLAQTSALTLVPESRGPNPVPPGELFGLGLELNPDREGDFETQVSVFTGDPVQPEIRVTARWRGTTEIPCRLAVAPAVLDFGTLAQGQSATRYVEVVNPSTAPCRLGGRRIEGAHGAFRVVGAGGPHSTLFLQARQRLAVAYSADEPGVDSGRLELSVGSAERPFEFMVLRGRALDGPVLEQTASVDIGPVGVGCQSPPQRVRLSNPTDRSATILEVATDTATLAFAPADIPPLPAVVAPGGEVALGFRFAPSSLGPYASGLVTTYEIGGERRTVVSTLLAVALQNPGHSDRFTQVATNRRFALSYPPFVGSIEVRVDDEPTDELDDSGQRNWTYDPSTNALVFEPDRSPSPGAAVEIAYRTNC